MTTVAEAGSFGAVRARPAFGHRLRRRSLPYLLLAPSLLLLAAFTYVPILRVAWESLYDQGHATGKSTFVGLGNYTALFALAVQRATRFNAVVRALLLFPSMIPLVAAASLFFFIFLPGVGLFDYYL